MDQGILLPIADEFFRSIASFGQEWIYLAVAGSLRGGIDISASGRSESRPMGAVGIDRTGCPRNAVSASCWAGVMCQSIGGGKSAAMARARMPKNRPACLILDLGPDCQKDPAERTGRTERPLFMTRKLIEHRAAQVPLAGPVFVFHLFTVRRLTVVYKGMLISTQTSRTFFSIWMIRTDGRPFRHHSLSLLDQHPRLLAVWPIPTG